VRAVDPKSSLSILLLVLVGGCQPGGNAPFNKQAWNTGRQTRPDLNCSPLMVADLLSNHLRPDMPLIEVTNLLGSPVIVARSGSALRKYGEFLEQTVYVYRPGLHNGWRLEGTNSLLLYFGHDGSYLKEWLPQLPDIKPVSAPESEATRSTLSTGGLHIGNLRFASTVAQFDQLLGAPDEKYTEYELDYYLGRRTRFSMDEVFLELHFNRHKQLTRAGETEH